MDKNPRKVRVPQQGNIRPPQNPTGIKNDQNEFEEFMKKALNTPPRPKKKQSAETQETPVSKTKGN